MYTPLTKIELVFLIFPACGSTRNRHTKLELDINNKVSYLSKRIVYIYIGIILYPNRYYVTLVAIL